MHQPTSQLVQHLILCIVAIIKLKAVRKVSAFHLQANLETHHTDVKFMKPSDGISAPCEQHQNQQRNAISESDKGLIYGGLAGAY